MIAVKPSQSGSTGSSLAREALDRRRLLKTAGGLGLALIGSTPVTGPSVAAHQSDAATPEPGPQDDGTNLWKVTVGGMDMENAVEYHGFFPGEITVNAGDSIWFAYDMAMFHTVTFPDADGAPP
ncbi:MAG: twin-arginine translocation signal domain-containing protein, partial [Thermomicrobiales bacterium]|nr:twin-arginine translocation signal domain-containing protein [Thermomicrobiales bacterium]